MTDPIMSCSNYGLLLCNFLQEEYFEAKGEKFVYSIDVNSVWLSVLQFIGKKLSFQNNILRLYSLQATLDHSTCAFSLDVLCFCVIDMNDNMEM